MKETPWSGQLYILGDWGVCVGGGGGGGEGAGREG